MSDAPREEAEDDDAAVHQFSHEPPPEGHGDAVEPPPDVEILPTASPESPWLGLRSFTERLRPYFFGRGAELRDLYERIVHKGLTVLFGQSGLGKTSLLQAGLVPRLREAGYLPVSVRLAHGGGANPLEWQVVSALRRALIQAGYSRLASWQASEIENLWRLFHDPAYALTGADDPRLDGLPPPRPVFLFDQFEEIFTLGERAECREDSRRFRDALACLVENRVPESLRARLETDDDLADRLAYQARPAKVLLSLRDDFLHVLERWRRQMPSLMDNRYELRLLTGPQALQAVVEPGRLRGPDRPPIIAEETGAAIVRFVAGTTADVPLAEIDAVPPLLSLICSELNARRFGPDGQPQEDTVRADHLQGQGEDILTDFYYQSFREVPEAVRELVEDRLLSADGFRESLALDTAHRVLETAGVAPAEARAAIVRLVDRRLLTVEERGSVRRVELTHDVLTGVARASRDARGEREAAEQARREQAAIHARAAEQRRTLRRARLVGTILALLAVSSLGALAWALTNSSEARRQTAIAQEKTTEAQKQAGIAQAKTREAEDEAKETERQAARAKGQIHQALLSDLATARNLLGKGNWREALMYLRRAQRYDDPANKSVNPWLWSAVVYGQGDRDRLPEYILRHEKGVMRAAYSPDGTRIVTACQDHTARQWDAATGRPVGEPLQHESSVTSAVYSPDGARVVTAGADGNVRQWDAATGQPIGQPLPHGRAVWHAAYSPDGARIVTACYDDTVRQWDAATGQPIGEPLQHKESVNSAVYSPDGTRVVTACQDHTARQWNAASGQPVGEPLQHKEAVNSAAYSPDGARIVTASDDKMVRQWDAATGKPVGEPLQHGSSVPSAAYSPDGTCIVTACNDGTVRQWDAATGKLLGEPLRHEGAVNSAVYSPDGARVIVACQDSTVRQWDAATGQPVGEALRHEGSVNSAVYSPDGTRIVTACQGHTARQWDAATGRPVGEPLQHGSSVPSAVYSPDGARVVTACGDGNVRQWDAATGQPVGELLQHGKKAVFSAAYSPDGARIVTACEDGTARQWDAVTGQPIGEPLRHGEEVHHAVYSPDGTRILTASYDHTARQWDAATGKPIGEPLRHADSVLDATYSRDGTRVVTACGDRTVRQWDAATGQPAGEALRSGEIFWGAVYSPDGTRILTAGSEQTARQWDCRVPAELPPKWLDDFVQMLSGLRFDENGELQSLTGEERLALRDALQKQWGAAPSSADGWERLARWSLAPPSRRAYTPNSTWSTLEIAQRELASRHQAGAETALRLVPDLPLVHLTLAYFPDYADRADFLRRYDLDRLPADTATRLRAVTLLRTEKQYRAALEIARGLAAHEPRNAEALRHITKCLESDPGLPGDALAAYDALLALPDAKSSDYSDAGYQAAVKGRGDRTREIFRLAEERFPESANVRNMEGWALLNLNAPAEALVAFVRYEQSFDADTPPRPEGLAGLAIARWLTGDRDGAVRDYQRAIAAKADFYADAEKIKSSGWTNVEKTPVLEVLAETMRRHPDLAPKPADQ